MMPKTLSYRLYLALRPYRDRFFDKIADFLININVKANQLTIFRGFLYIPTFLSVGISLWLTLFLIAVNMFLDAIDGLIARKTKNETVLGAKLDFFIDKLLLLPVLFGLWAYSTADWFWLIVYGSLFIFTLVFYKKNRTFEYGRFLLYFAIFYKMIGGYNLIDSVLVFLSFFQFVILINELKKKYIDG
jgi:phosphatidylglycerophosphate synthase